jgi:uncharacterized protein
MIASSKTLRYAITISTLSLVCAACRRQPKDMVPDYAKLRADRSANLSRPDGLISIVTLQPLKNGETIGSAKDNAVVVEHLPPHLGTLQVDGSVVRFRSEAQVDPSNGEPKLTGVPLPVVSGWDLHSSDAANYLHLDGLSFAAVKEKTKIALLAKDPQAPGLMTFPGLKWYSPQSKWRVVAHWVPYTTPPSLNVLLTNGRVEVEPAVGYAEFTLEGRKQRLVATEDDGHLFFVIGDLTNKTETYGGGRFIETAVADHGMHKEGTVVLDFNQLTNPYCAYSPFQNCPHPTNENELPLAITAGEKRFSE